jgi:hypothetical protein
MEITGINRVRVSFYRNRGAKFITKKEERNGVCLEASGRRFLCDN